MFAELLYWIGVALVFAAATFLLALVVNLIRKRSFREAWSASWHSAVNVFRWVSDLFI